MNPTSRFLVLAVISTCLMSASGCVCVTGGGGNPNTPGTALVTWRFPDNATCANAVPLAGEGIATVDIFVDNGSASRQSCSAGIASGSGLQISSLARGRHTIELRAYGTSGYQYFGVVNTIDITAGGTSAGEFSLQYVVGGFPVKWQFVAGNTAVTCADIGNPMVYINLKDGSGSFVYADAGQPVPCRDGQGVQGAYFPYLYGGTYQLYIQAVGSGNVLYRSNQNNPPSIAVTAGSFPALTANTFAFNVTNP